MGHPGRKLADGGHLVVLEHLGMGRLQFPLGALLLADVDPQFHYQRGTVAIGERVIVHLEGPAVLVDPLPHLQLPVHKNLKRRTHLTRFFTPRKDLIAKASLDITKTVAEIAVGKRDGIVRRLKADESGKAFEYGEESLPLALQRLFRLLFFDGPPDLQQELVDFIRLDQIVKGAMVRGVNRRAQRGIAGKNYDL